MQGIEYMEQNKYSKKEYLFFIYKKKDELSS